MQSILVEHTSSNALDALLERIGAGKDIWGAAIIRRDYLHPMTNEAFLMAIKPVTQRAYEVQVFYINDKNLCVIWRGKQKGIYLDLRGFISTSLMLRGLTIEPSTLVAYVDPRKQADDLKALTEKKQPGRADRFDEEIFENMVDDDDNDNRSKNDESSMQLCATQDQTDFYHEFSDQKAYRTQLQILVVEDQTFSQKLLCDILRGVRIRNNNESPVIDAVQGIREAWKIFIKKAPDITFIDLNLADGSGHTLARAIKELDPTAQVIIVTANNFEEELDVARQNNVDHFIAKPYNKKQILDCVSHYINANRTTAHGGNHGGFSRGF